ncbi:MAG TPA: M1 family aminopeptidase [Sandaracinaceae bacterium]
MRWLALLVALAVASPAGAQPGDWYETDDLLGSLRPAERSAVVAQAGLGSASELALYEIALQLADDLRSFELDETIWFTNRAGRPLPEIVLRVYANAVGDEPLVSLVRGECLDGLACSVSEVSRSAIVVRLARPLAPDGRLRMHLVLRGRLRDIAAERTTMMGQSLESLGALTGGHGHGDYGLLAHSDGVASMTYFFPMLARMRGGRWEQSDASTMGDLGNDELAHVRARIRAPRGVRVAASGVVSASGRDTAAVAGFVRDFAIVASRRFVTRERRVGDVVVRSWFLDGHDASGARVLDAAARSFALFTRRFGPYPYTELDVVEAPLVGGAGGMELSGLVTVATMFYRPMRAGDLGGLFAVLGARAGDLEAHRLSSLEVVTAHEVAHQWWHGLVGSDSRRHPFQDECLAQYSAMLYLEDRYGRERAEREAARHVAASYHMMRLMGRPDAAVDRPVSAFGDPLSYAGLVYGKGPYLYPALRRLLGDRAFFGAIQDYVRAHRFRMAPPRALFDRMARGRHAAEVRALERRWLEEAHGDADLGPPDLGRMLGVPARGDDPALRALQRLLGEGTASPEGLMRGLMEMLEEGVGP